MYVYVQQGRGLCIWVQVPEKSRRGQDLLEQEWVSCEPPDVLATTLWPSENNMHY